MRIRLALFALAILAQPASAQFTSVPAVQNYVAPTPPLADNGDRIATTAFVNTALSAGLPLASGKIFIGSAGNLATAQTPSGDCTISISGILTCTKTNGVVFATLATKASPVCSDLTNASAFCSGTDAAGLTGTVASARIAGSYTGITGVGTLTAGVWNGTTIAVANGGTNCAVASGTCLDNITGFAAAGIISRTGAGTYAARTITGTANEITSTNGDGVAANPTLSLPAALTFTGKTVTGGTFAGPTVTGSFTATGLVTNAALANPATTVAGQTCTLGSTCGLSTVTNSLGADVLMNNTANYFDGPSVAQGVTGTWAVFGGVTTTDTAGAATIHCKLWDGTTVIDSRAMGAFGGANSFYTATLTGTLASPAGNIRISCKDTSTTSGKILFNQSGNSKDSTLSAIRIN